MEPIAKLLLISQEKDRILWAGYCRATGGPRKIIASLVSRLVVSSPEMVRNSNAITKMSGKTDPKC